MTENVLIYENTIIDLIFKIINMIVELIILLYTDTLNFSGNQKCKWQYRINQGTKNSQTIENFLMATIHAILVCW